ncbi:MAG TPA: hypothetical protein VFS30_03010 [Dehalococcoidia bacterium]|nr:hypothetical protein [Dehalococcoidia bacterium]
MRKLVLAGILGLGLVAGTILPASATEGCNSGRGNYSEGDNSLLVSPHHGGTGPGTVGTVDCDPGNSGIHNRGGD